MSDEASPTVPLINHQSSIPRLRRVVRSAAVTDDPSEALLRAIREFRESGGSDAQLAALDDAFVVAAVRARSSVNESLVYAHHVFAEIDTLARRYLDRPIHSLLEIGPGANLGPLICFAGSGVTRAAGVDIARATPPAPEFYEQLRDYLSVVDGWRWWRLFARGSYPHVSFPNQADDLDAAATLAAIEYRAPVSSAKLPFDDASFDVVYSVAALEHVDDPAGTVAEIHRVLKPGGVAIHEIDLKHHGSADPLRFLEWTDEEWLAKSERYGNERSLERILDGSWTGEVFCNRLRYRGWLELFGAPRFALLLDEPLVVYEAAAIDPKRFAAPFRGMTPDELSILGFRLVARKR